VREVYVARYEGNNDPIATTHHASVETVRLSLYLISMIILMTLADRRQ